MARKKTRAGAANAETEKPLAAVWEFLESVLFVAAHLLTTDDEGRERVRDHVYRSLTLLEWERLRKFVDDTPHESSIGTLARQLKDHEIEFL